MFIVVKKGFSEKQKTIQVKVLGVFTSKSDAFSLAMHHCAIDFAPDTVAADKDDDYWSESYDAHKHKYLVEVFRVDQDRFDEVDIFSAQISNDKLGYAFNW